jgi:hypothetical protein
LEVPIDALAPGERREVAVTLGDPATIAGQVVHSGGEPVPFADVVLAPHGDSSAVAGGADVLQPGSQTQGDVEARERTATTDEAGGFVFEGIAPGEYDLRATPSLFMYVEAAVQLDAGERREVLLRLAPRSFFSGQAVGAPGASFEGIRVELAPAGGSTPNTGGGGSSGVPHGTYLAGTALGAALEPDGSFRLGPVPPGTYESRVRLPEIVLRRDFDGSSTGRGSERFLGMVELAPGENPGHEVDLRTIHPGRLRISVTMDAEPVVGVPVRAIGLHGEREEGAGGVLGPDGEIELVVFPHSYAVEVLAPDWLAAAPDLQGVGAGEVRDCRIDVRLLPGRLRVISAENGEPLAGTAILVRLAPLVGGLPFTGSISTRTDDRGELELRLPAGSYTASAGHPFVALLRPDRAIPFDWGPAGPSRPEIRLSPPSQDGFRDLPGENGR